MSAHDLALGLMLVATSFRAGVWVQRGYRRDELDHVTAALGRCGQLADQADGVAAGIDGDDDPAALRLAETMRTCGYLIRCAITGVPDGRIPDADERTTR